MEITDFFADRELACRATGIVRLDPIFKDRLLQLRLAWNAPMGVNSCCRSAAHNAAIGGHLRSLHIYDKPAHGTQGAAAIDIKVADAVQAWKLASLAMGLGWSVGVPRAGFLHLDRRADFGLPKGLFGY